MAAKVEIIYEAEASSLKATVNEVIKANDAIVADTKETTKEVGDEYKKMGGAAAAAFGGTQVKAALDQLNKESDKLTANLKELQKEQLSLIASGNKVSKAYQDNAKAQAALKSQISQVNAEQAELNRTFGETETKQKSLTGQLRGLKQQLAELEQQGKEDTEAFNQLLFAAARLEDQIGDTRERVRVLASDTFKFDAAVGATQALASGFEVAQGAAALFGSEGKELQEVIAKTTAVTAIANGVNELANQITGQGPLKLALYAAGQKAVAVATAISTGAISAFRVALAATGIGLFITGVALLVDKLRDAAANQAAFNRSLELSKQAAEGSRKAIQELQNQQLDLSTRYKLATGEITQAEADKQQLINETTKTVTDNIKIEQEAQKKNTEQIKRLSSELAQVEAANAAAVRSTRENARIQDTKGLKEQIAIQESELKASQFREQTLTILKNETISNINRTFAREDQAERDEEAKKAAEDRAKAAEEAAKAEREANNNRLNELAQLEKEFRKTLADQALEDANKTAEKQAEIDSRFRKRVLKEIEDSTDEQFTGRIRFLQTLEAQEGTSAERRIQILELEAKERQRLILLSVDDKTKANRLIELDEAKTQAAIREEQKKTRDEAVDYAFQIASETANAFASIVELQNQFSQNRIESIQEQSDKELEAINKSLDSEVTKENKREALQKRTQAKIVAEQQKQARREKALNIFKATIDTAASIVKTGAQLGYPAAIPFQVLAGIIGAANIAAIAAQPLPKFKRGGLVGGRSHEAGGTIIEAERGEFVVNKNSAGRHRTELDALNRSSAAFRKLIDERYVRPAILSYASKRKDGITVNASLNSKSMEKKLDKLNRTMSQQRTVVNINGLDSRYAWHRN